jgi:hypothetical protein
MKNLARFGVALLAVLALLAGCAHRADTPWTALIDGAKGLENWNRVGDANWRAAGNAIVADGGRGGFLVTKNSYKDFHLRAEFWASRSTNSGIFIRASNPTQITATNSYEVNIWDERPDPTYATGAIVGFAPIDAPVPQAGDRWNTFDIVARGNRVVVVMNGVRTVDMTHNGFAQGAFALQYGAGVGGGPGGPIIWRKVEIRPL